MALSNRARLERARVLRLQRNFTGADAELDALNSREAPALYEQAMVILESFAASDAQNAGREPVQTPVARQNARMEAFRLLQVGFSGQITMPEHAYVAGRGPLRLTQLANEMGKEDLESQLAERVNVAQDRFIVAQTAVNFLTGQNALAAEVNFNAGRAQLRLAALRATPPREECQASPEGAAQLNISAARGAFEAAREKGSNDAYWGLGCVFLTQREFDDAIGAFRRAIDNLGATPVLPRSEYYLGLARAQAASSSAHWGNPAEGEGSETAGALGSFRAALAAEQNPARIHRIRLELADVYGRMGGASMEGRALNAYAIVLRESNVPDLRAEAFYQRGLLHKKRNDPGALADFQSASEYNGHPRQAAANYELSELLKLACGVRRPCANAVRAADRAVLGSAGQDEATRMKYRRQACLLRIRFRYTDQGQAACTNVESGPQGTLYEGMFWLTEASGRRGGRQQDAWSAANQAFKRGSEELTASGQAAFVGDLNLLELLNYGQRIVLYCLGGGGADTSPVQQQIPRFFVDHGVPECSAAR